MDKDFMYKCSRYRISVQKHDDVLSVRKHGGEENGIPQIKYVVLGRQTANLIISDTSHLTWTSLDKTVYLL